MEKPAVINDRRRRKFLGVYLKNNWQLYLMLMVPVIFVIVFKYAAYPGLRIAFMDYKPAKGYAGSKWVGLGTFEKIFRDKDFARALKNSLVFNFLDLLVGFLVFGKGFGIKTAVVSTLMSAMIWVLERVLPMDHSMTSQPLMELIFAVSLPAVGSAILFNLDASTGGTDIVAMVLRKFTSLNIGNALMISDSIITVMACVAFGMETGLFSILGLLMKSLLVDMVLENINTHKYFHIITTHPREIEEYITRTLKRGATELHGEGAYTHEGRSILLTVMNRRQGILLRRYVRSVDPHAFVLIMNTGDIIGKGFRGTN